MPLFIVTALSFLLLDAAGFGPIQSVRRTALTVGDPIGRALSFVVSPLTGAWLGAVDYDDLAQENRELRRRNAELAGRLAGQPDAVAELEALLAATEIDFLGDVERVTARVTGDRRTDVERVVEIDKGSTSGIVPGMPAVTGLGLAGVVAVVADDHAIIRLISDVEVAVGVRSEYGIGLATGSGHGLLNLAPTPELADSVRLGAADTGERFFTSGVDRSIFPAGIPIGTLLITYDDQGSDVGGQSSSSPAGPTANPTYGAPTTGTSTDTTVQEPGREAMEADRPSGDVDFKLRPLADLDNLGYLTVLLIAPTE